MFFSKVFSTFIGKYRGGQKDSIISKVTAKGNTYQSKNAFGPGIEINPAQGERLILSKIDDSDSYLVSIAGLSDSVAPDTNPGERRFFSVDTSLALAAYLKLKNTGILELNGNDNFAVLFNELLTEFNELQSKYNDLATKYNSHTHQDAEARPTSGPSNSSSQSEADINNVKSNKVLLPDN